MANSCRVCNKRLYTGVQEELHAILHELEYMHGTLRALYDALDGVARTLERVAAR